MLLQPKITILDVPQSQALEKDILKRVEKLEQFYPNLTSCDVVIRQEQKHQSQGRLYRPRISLNVPGDKINVNHSANENVYVALRDAFNACQRQLKEFSRRQRGDVKHHELPMRGQVARVFSDEGFGFISAIDDEEYYFDNFSLNNIDIDDLKPGMSVEFIGDSNGSGLQAKRISLLKRS